MRRRNTPSRYTEVGTCAWSIAITKQLIIVDPEVHGGTPVFAGTRVPVKTLFDHLEAGDSLEVFLSDFPSVSRELAQFDVLLTMDGNIEFHPPRKRNTMIT